MPTHAKEIQGEGLKSFEDFIHFQRVGCPFLKHEIPIQAFYHETLLSLHNHLQKRPQRTCGICNKEARCCIVLSRGCLFCDTYRSILCKP